MNTGEIQTRKWLVYVYQQLEANYLNVFNLQFFAIQQLY